MSKDLFDLVDDEIKQFHREYEEARQMVKFHYLIPNWVSTM